MVSIKKIRERINSLKKRIERKMNKLVQHHKLEVMGEKLDRLMNMHKTAIKIIEKNIFSDISEDDLIQGNCLNREVPKEEIAKLEEIICRMFEKIFSQRLF